MTEEITDNITVPQKHNIVIFEPYFVCSILVVNRALLSQVKYVSKSAVIRLILKHSGTVVMQCALGLLSRLKGCTELFVKMLFFRENRHFRGC